MDSQEAIVSGFLDREREVVIARGEFSPLFAAYRSHARKWNSMPDDQALGMMNHMLAAAALYLAIHPPDEFAAWTLNIVQPPINFFVCGDNQQFAITGRAYTQNVKNANSNRLFMESQRPRREPSRSVLDVAGGDVLDIFEQFFNKSDQIPSRLFARAANEIVLIQGMPGVDLAWLQSLDSDSVRGYLKKDFENIEQRNYRFQCGCDPGKILTVVSGMFKDNPEDLFRGDSEVETHCPRCSRSFWITREDFDLGPQRVGIS